MWKTEQFLFRWTLWVLTQIYSKTRVYWNCLLQSIWKFLQRQPIPTHYLQEMLTLILKENFFHFTRKHYLQNHRTAMGTKTAVLIPDCQYFHDIYWTTTLSKTVFRTTVWKCYIHDIFSLWDMSKPDIEAFIEQANSHHPTIEFTPKHLTLRLLFRHGCIQRHKIQGKIYPLCKDTF